MIIIKIDKKAFQERVSNQMDKILNPTQYELYKKILNTK